MTLDWRAGAGVALTSNNAMTLDWRAGVALTSNENAALVKYLHANAMTLGWKLPFFFPPIAHIRFAVDPHTLTASVDLTGLIRFNPVWAKTLTTEELQFVIAHELGHLLLLHHARMGDRIVFKWNCCADLIWNATLKKVAATGGQITPLANMIYAEKSQEGWTVEQLYAEMPDPKVIVVDLSQITVGNGCGPLPSPGDGDNPSNPSSKRTEAGWHRLWREVAAQAQFRGRDAKGAGSVAGNILAHALDVPDARVRWAEVLRRQFSRVLSEAGNDDVSWSRRSRRSTPEIILPGGVTYKCCAAVAIDTSGSMSDEDLAHAVAETAAIVNHTKVSAFLVVHDYDVQEACWIRPGGRAAVVSQIQKRLKGRGGTSFHTAYKRVEQEGKFNVLVHMTDGCVEAWPEKPVTVRRLVVALLGYANDALVPKDARVIRVET
jgi:predicted metal-dependent peptidase